jgi:hypothetical protein
VVGLVLIVVASGLLFWNEVRLIDFGLFRMWWFNAMFHCMNYSTEVNQFITYHLCFI